MENLKAAVEEFARKNANDKGLAQTQISGLMMKYHDVPTGEVHAVYSPMMCFILQGKKHISIGSRTTEMVAGRTFIVSNSVPTVGKIIAATPTEPYVAIAVKIDRGVLGELVAELDQSSEVSSESSFHCFFDKDADDFLVDCLFRMVRLLAHPRAAVTLRASIMKELHFWLITGEHGGMLRSLVNSECRIGRLEKAVALLRTDYSSRLSAETLARSAGMSVTSFHKHFKQLTAMTPGQYQKSVRLIEARRLMLEHNVSATQAALSVGYESTSQFSRDYVRMFDRPPKRDLLAVRSQCSLPAENRWVVL